MSGIGNCTVGSCQRHGKCMYHPCRASMTIEVTQEDRDDARRMVLEFKGREWPAKEEEIARFYARRRQAAYEKGFRAAHMEMLIRDSGDLV